MLSYNSLDMVLRRHYLTGGVSRLLQEQFHCSFGSFRKLYYTVMTKSVGNLGQHNSLEAWATLVDEAGNRRLAFPISRVEEGRREISKIGIHQPTNSRGDVNTNTRVTVNLFFVDQIVRHLVKKLIIGPYVLAYQQCSSTKNVSKRKLQTESVLASEESYLEAQITANCFAMTGQYCCTFSANIRHNNDMISHWNM